MSDKRLINKTLCNKLVLSTVYIYIYIHTHTHTHTHTHLYLIYARKMYNIKIKVSIFDSLKLLIRDMKVI
jgi:hypothetical protein